jgi:hypothetical protein
VRTIQDNAPPVRRRFLHPAAAVLAGLAALLLASCERAGADWREGRADQPSAAPAADYVRPPQITGATRAADMGVVLSGQAGPEVSLRLVSPDGGAYGATADDRGRWTLTVPPGQDVRLFGLSEEIGGRVVQAEGYIAVLPPPGRPAVLLRAGGGASALGAPSALQLAAVDFDPAGAVVLSGQAQPGVALRAMVDGVAGGDSHAGQKGHYTLALSNALKPGSHHLQVEAAGQRTEATIAVSPPPAQHQGLPYRGARVDGGWRIDWLTPGGGPQATLVLDAPGGAS